MQKDELGVLYPISYYSHKFNQYKIRLSIYEKETWSIILAITKFESYIEIRKFDFIKGQSGTIISLGSKERLWTVGEMVSKAAKVTFK